MTDWLTEQDERNAVLLAEMMAIVFANAQAITLMAHHVTQAIQPALHDFDMRLSQAMGTGRYYA